MNVPTVHAHHNPKSSYPSELERFAAGLADAGHGNERVDLHAIHFHPVFRARDAPNWIDESIPGEGVRGLIGSVGPEIESEGGDCFMTATKQIPRQQWKEYFDRFTKRYLRDDRPEAATLEFLSPALGDQFEVRGARLLGISYDPKSEALEILLKNMDHLVFQPKEISAIEEKDAFVSGVEIVRGDGTKEVLTIRRAGG